MAQNNSVREETWQNAYVERVMVFCPRVLGSGDGSYMGASASSTAVTGITPGV